MVQLDHGDFMLDGEASDDSDHEGGSETRRHGPLLTVGDVPIGKRQATVV